MTLKISKIAIGRILLLSDTKLSISSFLITILSDIFFFVLVALFLQFLALVVWTRIGGGQVLQPLFFGLNYLVSERILTGEVSTAHEAFDTDDVDSMDFLDLSTFQPGIISET